VASIVTLEHQGQQPVSKPRDGKATNDKTAGVWMVAGRTAVRGRDSVQMPIDVTLCRSPRQKYCIVSTFAKSPAIGVK
jgi:hypothetical protein